MSDYIKREDARELFEMILESYKDAGIQNISMIVSIAPPEFHMSEDEEVAEFNSELDGWRNDFMKIESADVAPVRHGRWIVIDAEEPRRYGCSECKRLSWHMENYCPNCGARMDGDEGDD